jgi:hypothetical protein
MATSAFQITANQANALHSTGPRTDEGKHHSSRNHQSHGLTTRHALLPGEDLDQYQLHHQAYTDRYSPTGSVSQQLVTELSDLKWRLQRVSMFEAQLLCMECTRLTSEPEFEPLIKTLNGDIQVLALAFTRLVASKVLPNLHHQEARLARRVEKIERQLDTRRIAPFPAPMPVEQLDEPAPEPPETTAPQNQKIEPIRVAAKVGRNELCPCKSGLKYKRCCLLRVHEPTPSLDRLLLTATS